MRYVEVTAEILTKGGKYLKFSEDLSKIMKSTGLNAPVKNESFYKKCKTKIQNIAKKFYEDYQTDEIKSVISWNNKEINKLGSLLNQIPNYASFLKKQIKKLTSIE